jgi:hypothetical protein
MYVHSNGWTGKDKKFRTTVSDRISARSRLLWNREATGDEWEEFLTEVVTGKPVSNLHVNVPTAPMYNVGKKYPRA